MTHFTELETQIYSKRGTISRNTPEATILPKFNKSQIKDHIILFIKNMVSKHTGDITIELLVSDIAKLFKEWQNSNNYIYDIDNTNLGVLLHHIKIKGISKGRRKNTGNMKKFNIQQIKDHFNEGATQTPPELN
jgi:hypothetical protein